MPPADKKLSAREKAVLAAWIDRGAPTARPEPASADALAGPTEEEKSFWSFQPIRRPEVPRVKARAGSRTRSMPSSCIGSRPSAWGSRPRPTAGR